MQLQSQAVVKSILHLMRVNVWITLRNHESSSTKFQNLAMVEAHKERDAMNDDFHLTTNQACRIVEIDPSSLNSHIAAGRFPCLPTTIRGSVRLFDFDDVLALWLFRTLLGQIPKAKDAGYFACEIAGKARGRPDAQFISIVETVIGSKTVFIFENVFDPEEPKTRNFGAPVHGVTHFDMTVMRDEITRRVKELESSK